ncbi:MAG TPA: MerR family transcriptional regulator [Chromatiales bacterium]|nr:MerR family transcriptional regulator [Chromatiales bacterium]
MRKSGTIPVVTGELLDESAWLSLGELARICSLDAEYLLEMVEEGVLEPRGSEMRAWRFPPASISRVRVVVHLRRDLGVNLAGAALALDLLDEMDRLHARLRSLGYEE